MFSFVVFLEIPNSDSASFVVFETNSRVKKFSPIHDNLRKTRRKGDRGECGSTEDGSEQKLYLQSPLLECRIPEPDLIFLSDLPGGLDYNEWLASHSKLLTY